MEVKSTPHFATSGEEWVVVAGDVGSKCSGKAQGANRQRNNLLPSYAADREAVTKAVALGGQSAVMIEVELIRGVFTTDH